MGQVNRGTPFKRATIEGAQDGERRLARRDCGLRERAVSAARQSEDEAVGLPPSAPQSWPRLFPGL
jgi:hypothetical protein